MGGRPRVAAVVVTWNRRELLAEALQALCDQTRPPDALVVVDNASADETAQLVRADFPEADLMVLVRNLGGAGGFAAGIRRALDSHDPDLIWLLDDDTVPESAALAALLAVRQRYRGDPPPSLLASRVLWTDGREHPMNTPRRKLGARRQEVHRAKQAGGAPIRSASFVSIAVDAAAVRERGLPIADYFVWNDDFEYTTRLLRNRVGLLCPDSVVVHKTRTYGDIEADPGERFVFEVRNKVWLFTRSPGLNALERTIYLGATVRRWLRTVAGSNDRRTLLRAGSRGLAAALRAGPRDTGELIANARQIPDDVAPGSLVPVAADHAPGALPFSLLLPVFAGDRPGFLRQAFASTVVDQSRRPDDVVIVQDGPVPAPLARVLAELVESSPVPVTLVPLEHNVGLGPALDAGLAACKHDVIARMDADDVSVPHRFAVQLPAVESGADIVGSALMEFVDDIDDVVLTRVPPLDPVWIRSAARFRDPFNHPTVVYRRSVVQAVGGYQQLPLMEDYLLFARMLAQGAQPANIAEPLVYYRIGAGAYARRGGQALLRSELALQRRFHELGITTRSQYVRNVVIRGGYRLVPERVRRIAYRRLIARRGIGGASDRRR